MKAYSTFLFDMMPYNLTAAYEVGRHLRVCYVDYIETAIIYMGSKL